MKLQDFSVPHYLRRWRDWRCDAFFPSIRQRPLHWIITGFFGGAWEALWNRKDYANDEKLEDWLLGDHGNSDSLIDDLRR